MGGRGSSSKTGKGRDPATVGAGEVVTVGDTQIRFTESKSGRMAFSRRDSDKEWRRTQLKWANEVIRTGKFPAKYPL